MRISDYGSFEEIELTRNGGVFNIELSTPQNDNRVTRRMVDEILYCLAVLEFDTSCRVIVLSGKGDYFCGGTDLKWLKQGKIQTKQQNISDSKALYQLFESLYSSQKPIVAKLPNNVSGIGIGIVACADIVVASETAVFTFPDLRMGIVPATVLPFVLKKCGEPFVRRMVFTADEFSAAQALAAGLVTDVAPQEMVEQKTANIVAAVLRNAPRATLLTKQMLSHFSDFHEIDEHMAVYCAKANALTIISEEGYNGVIAYMENYTPFWNL